MQSPKITVIGAGSFFFGRPVIWNMVNSTILKGGTLALVDTNPETLKTMMDLAKRAIEATGSPTQLIGSTDRREVLPDSDFVVLTFSDRNAHFRGVDCRISEKYGIRMCSGDTIGPGGIFRALREIPHALDIARDVEELSPRAWIINFVNPTTVLGMALRRYSPVRSFAICDGLHEPYARMNLLKKSGILSADAVTVPSEVEQKLDLRIAGVNHFTWLTKFQYDGTDWMPKLAAVLEKDALQEQKLSGTMSGGLQKSDNNAHAKSKFNSSYTIDLYKLYGIIPQCIAHTKEYVPFYQNLGVSPVFPEPLRIFDAVDRANIMKKHMNETRAWANGEKDIHSFLDEGKGDHATDIIESMWGGLGKPFFINTANKGAVTNLSDDAFLELRCDLDMQGPRPQTVGDFPRGVLGMQQIVLDTHELTAQAAVEFDRDILLRALATDPIIQNIGDARAVMNELLEEEMDALPKEWQK